MKKRAYIGYLSSLLLFGSNGIIASHIPLDSLHIVLLRTMLGSALLIALFFLTGNKPTVAKYPRDVLYVALSGMAMGGSWIFLFEAYAQIGVSISSLLYYCGPVIVMILSPLLFKERLTPAKIIGFLIVLCGVILINGHTAEKNKYLGINLRRNVRSAVFSYGDFK